MISISQKVKSELSQLPTPDGASALAELAAVLSCAASLGMNNAGYYVEAAGGGPHLKARVDVLLKKLYGLTCGEAEPTVGLKNQGGSFRVSGMAAERLLEDCQILVRGEEGLLQIARGVDRYLVEDDAAARAYLAGAFTAAGSLSVPAENQFKVSNKRAAGTGYHLEFAVTDAELADGLAALLKRFDIYPKKVLRKGKNIIYLKGGDSICGFLALVGAEQAALYLNGLIASKSLNNEVNRRVNSEAANIGRAVAAAARQLKAVKLLKERRRLESLPDGLRDLAKARLSRPELGMAELGAMFNPPLSKSGVNHRFERIIKLAEDMAQN